MPEDAEGKTETRKRRSLRRRLLFSTIVGIAFFLLLLIADRVAGLFFPPTTESLLFPSGSRVRHESSEFDVTVSISKAGIRDRDYTAGTPPDSVYRIVAVGDSFTFGWGVESKNAWPNVVERILNSNRSKQKSSSTLRFEVLNFGFPGASPFDYETATAQAIRHFRPHLLIVGILQGDDLIQLQENRRQQKPLLPAIAELLFPTTRRLLRGHVQPQPMRSYRETFFRSQQYVRSKFSARERDRYAALSPRVRDAFEEGLLNPSLVQRAIEVPDHFLLPTDAGGDWTMVAANRLSDSLLRIKRLCDSSDCRMIVAVVPNGPYVSPAAGEGMKEIGYTISPMLLQTDVPDRVVRDVCGKLEIPCLVQTADFRRVKTENYFPLDGHFNKNGQRRFAANLAEFLNRKMDWSRE